ncbi:hypothetical protein BDV59DRAFT_29478 [Aspergillus ambiguus]|uniref:putative Rho guanyl nucleotide exchange factor n=1 Tax=Aspergillus ambiguus TaxID=176160 RepID=UPI003CCDB747
MSGSHVEPGSACFLNPQHSREPSASTLHHPFYDPQNPPSSNPDDYYRSPPLPPVDPPLESIPNPHPSQRVSSVPTHPPPSSSLHSGPPRSASDTYKTIGVGSASRSDRLPTARPRQVSFKDLVNKFNNNIDEVLPLPSAPVSRDTSRAPSPVSPVDGSGRHRSAFRPRNNGPSAGQPSLSRWSSNNDLNQASVPPSTSEKASGFHHHLASRLTPLSPQDSLPRRPQFGKLLSVDTSFHTQGHGIPSHLRRRGSEGSIASPNPGLLDPFDPSPGRSPLTPTAWYLGHTPFLEAVSTTGHPHNHRRTRSDISGTWVEGVAVAHAPGSHMAVPAPLQPSSPTSLEGSPHSKSRIPVSSRRLNSGSVSGDSSPTNRAESTFSSRAAAQVSLPPKGISRLPKPAPRSPPPAPSHEGSPTFALSPGSRRDMANGRSRRPPPVKGPLLEAYIAAPPPKKSPPLRSSRPRQPVSHTSSSTARSRVGERVSSFQKQIINDREPRSSRPRDRRLPELGNVDFATRRQRIQQAFNRTVQENERKEERAAELRRQVKAREEKHEQQPPTPALEHPREDTPKPTIPPPPEDTATVIEDCPEPSHEAKQLTPQSNHPPAPPQLRVDTDVCSQGSECTTTETYPMTMDSPTLGKPDGALKVHPKSDVAPVSAVSTDTHVTTFDPEPQEGLTRQNIHASHRTLLSQIMQIRESSPESSSCDDPDYSMSETDEPESVPIMLRDAVGSDDCMDSSDNQEPSDLYNQHDTSGNGIINRWSMSSWSSSLRNQHSTDDQCEASGDDLSQIQPSVDESEAATTQSCSASSTPESVTIPQISQPPQEHRTGLVSNPEAIKAAYGHSNAPNLARLGGWDSNRVTQLYLEELTRGRGHQLPMPAVRASPEPRTSLGKRADGRTDSLTDEPVVVSSKDLPPPERLGHTASLVLKDDWEHASPSILDWMQVAAEEAAPPPPPKDTNIPNESAPTPRPNPQGPSSEAANETLGLAINVELPREDSDPRPLPQRDAAHIPTDAHGAEPLPVPPAKQAQQQSPSQHPPFAPLGPVQSAGSSGDSSLRNADSAPSLEAMDSSSTSLVPSTHEKVRAETTSPSPEQRRLKKRRHVIKELVDTEYSFGRDMKVVDDIYKGTSSSCLDLSADDVKVLFANSDQVVHFSTVFLDSLKEAARSVYVMPKSQRWSSKRGSRHHLTRTDTESSGAPGLSELEKDHATSIGEAFMTNMAQMEKVYADYLKNHDAANKKLQTLQRNPKVAIWLKECRDWASDLTSAWDLDSLLVKPVQRILKYPLLLTELLDTTPDSHPDRPALLSALEEVTNISVRINEMKKRADLVGQVVGRKRKESDVRAGLSKAFGRRTEKLKQQVGLSELVEDKEYDSLSQRFGDNFFQLQVVMRDAEMYTREVQGSLTRFSDFVSAIEGFIDVAQTNYSELEGKWRELRVTIQGLLSVALPDHVATVRKSVIDPMVTLLKLHDSPQRVMRKRDKRLMDYARFKAIRDRGDKPDKKTAEQGEQFVALNETLKDELPKLYSLTAKLMEACLENFVQIQSTWFNTLQEKLTSLVDAFPEDLQKLVGDWSAASNFSEAQVLSLGICNGSLLADAVNLVNFNTPSTGAAISSPRRPSTVNSSSTRVGSGMEDSPKVSHDFSNSSRPFQSPSLDSQSQISHGRRRTDSTFSGRTGGDHPEIPRSQALQHITHGSSTSVPASNANTESFPSLPRLSLDSPFLADLIGPPNEAKPHEEQPTSPGGRYSGFFSSAMPMSDNPQDNARPENEAPKEPAVLFLAASIYEFNIDRARREAGYPYLTYVAGEIFDVIAEKGELWLAKNQDDPTNQVGWIWNKHFAKLSS